MESTHPHEMYPLPSQSPDGFESDDVTLIAHQSGSLQGCHQESAYFGTQDSVLCATLLGSGAFADEKGFDCERSPMNISTTLGDLTQPWAVPNDQQKGIVDPPKRESVIPLFKVSSTIQHESLSFDVTPPSLRRVQEKLAMRDFSALSSSAPNILSFNALGITPWSPSQSIRNCTLPWTDLRALEFHPIFFSPESGAKMSVMRSVGAYSGGSTYTPSLTSSSSAGTPPFDSMIKQRLAVQEKRPTTQGGRVMSPPSPWFPSQSGGSPALANSSLSRQLFEKLLRESSAPRPAAIYSRVKESGGASSNDVSGFFTPQLVQSIDSPLLCPIESASQPPMTECSVKVFEKGITRQINSDDERGYSLRGSISVDSALLHILQRCTAKDNLPVRPTKSEMRSIAIQTDLAPVSCIQGTRANESGFAIRIVALKSTQSLVSEVTPVDRMNMDNSASDAVRSSGVTLHNDEVNKTPQGSVIGRIVRLIFGC